MGTDQNPDQTKPPSSFVVISRISDPTSSASEKLPCFGKNLTTQDVIILPSLPNKVVIFILFKKKIKT